MVSALSHLFLFSCGVLCLEAFSPLGPTSALGMIKAAGSQRVAQQRPTPTPQGRTSSRLRIPLCMKRGYAEGPYGQVHFHDTETGDGTPLVLLPMAPGSCLTFENVLPELKKAGIRAIAIDPPGCGMSDPAPSFPTIEERAPVVGAVMEHLGIDRFSVLGVQTGAKIAAAAAVAYGERVERAVLVNPLLGTEADITDAREKLKDGTLYDEFRWQNNIDDEGEHLKTWFGWWYDDINDAKLATRFVCDVFTGLADERLSAMAAKMYNLKEAMLAMRTPTLLVGVPSSPYYPRTEETFRVREDFEVFNLSNEVGSAYLDDASELVAAVKKFLQS